MIDPSIRNELSARISKRIQEDQEILEQIRREIAPHKNQVRRIQPRSVTSLAFVGTDGGNNQLRFDPFLVQIIRVVDSSNNSYAIDVITPDSDIRKLSEHHWQSADSELGQLMRFLNVDALWRLSPMIPKPDQRERSPSWVQVYRELTEWATLFYLIRHRQYGTDTLLVFDGLLRSKVFAGELFLAFNRGIADAIMQHEQKHRRKIYLTGVAKHSKVLDRYELSMALEGVLKVDYPAYLEVPRAIEAKAYVWPEYARGETEADGEREANKFVGGKMFLVKFGARSRDPIWPVDLFEPQATQAPAILGSLLADAIDGFPIPHYPRCLQKAHENAALVDFDFDILQDEIYRGIRKSLGEHAPTLDAFLLRTIDVAARRY
jgi:hypothetical protein